MTIDAIMRTALVIPVIVIDHLAHAVPLAEALGAGGLPVLEVTKLHEQKGITITHQEVAGADHFFREDDKMAELMGSVGGYVKRRLTESTR